MNCHDRYRQEAHRADESCSEKPGTPCIRKLAEGARVLAGPGSGDGPLRIRARPSSIKRDCGRRTTSAGRRFLANVHATLDPGDLCGHSGQKTRARPEPARTDAGHDPHWLQGFPDRRDADGTVRSGLEAPKTRSARTPGMRRIARYPGRPGPAPDGLVIQSGGPLAAGAAHREGRLATGSPACSAARRPRW